MVNLQAANSTIALDLVLLPGPDPVASAAQETLSIRLMPRERLEIHAAKHLIARTAKEARRIQEAFGVAEVSVLPEVHLEASRAQGRIYIRDVWDGKPCTGLLYLALVRVLKAPSDLSMESIPKPLADKALWFMKEVLFPHQYWDEEIHLWRMVDDDPRLVVETYWCLLEGAVEKSGATLEELSRHYQDVSIAALRREASHPRHAVSLSSDGTTQGGVWKRIFCTDEGLLVVIRRIDEREWSLATCFAAALSQAQTKDDAGHQVREYLRLLNKADRLGLKHLYDERTWTLPEGPMTKDMAPEPDGRSLSERARAEFMEVSRRAEFLWNRLQQGNARFSRRYLVFSLLATLDRGRLLAERDWGALDSQETDTIARCRKVVRDVEVEMLRLYSEDRTFRQELLDHIRSVQEEVRGPEQSRPARRSPEDPTLDVDELLLTAAFDFLTRTDVFLAGRTLGRLEEGSPTDPEDGSSGNDYGRETVASAETLAHPFGRGGILEHHQGSRKLAPVRNDEPMDLGGGLEALWCGDRIQEARPFQALAFWTGWIGSEENE